VGINSLLLSTEKLITRVLIPSNSMGLEMKKIIEER